MYTPNFHIQHEVHRIIPIWLQYACTVRAIVSRIYSYCLWNASLSFLAGIFMMFVVVYKMATQSFTGLFSTVKVHVLSEDRTAIFAANESIVWFFAHFLSPVSLLNRASTPTISASIAICKTLMSPPRRFLLLCLEQWKPICNSMLLRCRFSHFPRSIWMYAPSYSVIKYICQIPRVLGMFGSFHKNFGLMWMIAIWEWIIICR